MNRLAKLARCMAVPEFRHALFRHRVAGAVEHLPVLRTIPMVATVVDIGANRGQFALAARRAYPRARILSFEPLAGPAAAYRGVLGRDPGATLFEAAVGPKQQSAIIHVSARDDSSSLLPISANQTSLFPGTEAVETRTITVTPLDRAIDRRQLMSPVLLKIDVQGFELDALRGCEPVLDQIAWAYVECSFLELYEGQALADEVVSWLRQRGFQLAGAYNPYYSRSGRAIQADLLFASHGVADRAER